MTTFTKEQLISHARESVSYLEDLKGRASKEGEDCKVVLEMVERELELARIALASLEAEPVAWKVTFTQIDREYNTFTGMYSDKAEVERWVRLHKACNFRADITPLYTAQPAPVTPDGWISCSERMPDTKTAVLVAREFDRKGDWRMKWATYIPGHPDANDGWIIPGASWIPSHWMPLPEPPQEAK
ncbi:TPA: DUF551 domain-containing protein [Escherichia coli]|uniref:DUF551 domain-containing protein n=1 Tax=Escherichia coli TaxID=562 RepID=UPI001990DD55|nr:DUF551 domain-containing protein [Escherichia coli]MDX5579925.1 DUF551 domain-containing protein [Escherichia coli]HAN5969586.1 DUF551 domain-containing protein [Escherichia coli]HCP6008121.1 DUF551 domain-containing protein [Escherichia coli]HCP9983924.1 DUF551 domain-containing protein [Escherichia coli]